MAWSWVGMNGMPVKLTLRCTARSIPYRFLRRYVGRTVSISAPSGKRKVPGSVGRTGRGGGPEPFDEAGAAPGTRDPPSRSRQQWLSSIGIQIVAPLMYPDADGIRAKIGS